MEKKDRRPFLVSEAAAENILGKKLSEARKDKKIRQNAFVKLMTADVTFTDDEHIRRWLIRVAVNECRNSLNSFWRRRVSFFDELEQEPSASDDERWLLSEIGRLPAQYSAVLYLHYYEGYRCAEIGALLHLSESNVQTRLMRARKMLKKRLEEA